MPELKWSSAEKARARELFESARTAELTEIILRFKKEAESLSSPDELWLLAERTLKARREFEAKYDFRYSQLPWVFAQLLREQRIAKSDLQGLGMEKAAHISSISEL